VVVYASIWVARTVGEGRRGGGRYGQGRRRVRRAVLLTLSSDLLESSSVLDSPNIRV